MADIADEIYRLINSDGGMEKIKSIAGELLNNSENSEKSAENSSNSNEFSIEEMLNNAQNIQSIMRVMSVFQNQQEDKRINLLLSLKPHLSVERAKRIDTAVTLIKIAGIIPILKEEGVLNGLGLNEP